MELRILVWNVHGFSVGVHAVADVVASTSPDVVIMAECGSRRDVESFADRLRLQAVHATLPWRFLPAARNAVFARQPWRIVDVAGGGLTKGGGKQPRGVVIAKLVGPQDRPATIVGTHLGLHQGERAAHADEILRMVDGTPFPAFVGGDFNEHEGGPSHRAMVDAGLRDAWRILHPNDPGFTYPSETPEARIDYLFVPDERVTVRKVEVLEAPTAAAASDHLPLVADVFWGTEAEDDLGD